MNLLDNLASNQKDWAVPALEAGDPVNPSLVGVRNNAVVISIVMPESKIMDGQFDAPAKAAYARMLLSECDTFLIAGLSESAEINDGPRKAFIVASSIGEVRVMPVATFTKSVQTGESYIEFRRLDLFNQMARFIPEKDVDWMNSGMKYGNLVLDLEERFGVPTDV